MTILFCKNDATLRYRFGLNTTQIRYPYLYKNLWWDLNGMFFGYGDLDSADVFRIQNRLEADDTFRGWNEHHQTEWQQTDVPMIRIKRNDITMHIDLLEEEGKTT